MLNESTIEALRRTVESLHETTSVAPDAAVRCGVDLGTSSIIVVVVDDAGRPVAAELQPCQVARDGLVVDYMGAIDIVRKLTRRLEGRLGLELHASAIAVPPGTSTADSGAHRHVVEAAGLDVTAVLDEPTAANSVLGVTDGAVVDLGGGTTGLTVFRDGQVIHSTDEATGGTHMSLVLMRRFGITYDEAEELKRRPDQARDVATMVRPVAEKMASIVADEIAGQGVNEVWLVGGTAGLLGIEDIFADRLGVPTRKPSDPMMVTPLGIALNARIGGGPC